MYGILSVYTTCLAAVRELVSLQYGNKKKCTHGIISVYTIKVDVWYSKCVHYLFCCSTGTKKCMYGIINVYTTFDAHAAITEQRGICTVLSLCIANFLTYLLQ